MGINMNSGFNSYKFNGLGSNKLTTKAALAASGNTTAKATLTNATSKSPAGVQGTRSYTVTDTDGTRSRTDTVIIMNYQTSGTYSATAMINGKRHTILRTRVETFPEKALQQTSPAKPNVTVAKLNSLNCKLPTNLKGFGAQVIYNPKLPNSKKV